jgi:hypothetical protein
VYPRYIEAKAKNAWLTPKTLIDIEIEEIARAQNKNPII